MAYQMISYGSSGDSVKELQQLLNQQGYALDVDGIFGNKTRQAVRSYQKKNGLRLDGIVGEETWGSLHNKSLEGKEQEEAAPAVSPATARALSELEQGYTPSAEVQTAMEEWQQAENRRPQPYTSAFEEEMAALYGEITQRPAFSYDPAADPVYAAYARQYAAQGKAAMEDTLGKAAALTGGYGSTYAETAAQQTYGQYMEKLASQVLPEREKNAYARYQAQGQALLDRYNLLKGQDKEAYDRWQQAVEQWRKDVTAAREKYHTLQGDDLENYQALLKYYADKAAREYTAG